MPRLTHVPHYIFGSAGVVVPKQDINTHARVAHLLCCLLLSPHLLTCTYMRFLNSEKRLHPALQETKIQDLESVLAEQVDYAEEQVRGSS